MKTLPILAFAVTAALGWLLAGNTAPAAKSAGPASAVPARQQRPDRHRRKTSGPGGPEGMALAAIRTSRDPASRMRATVDLANAISPADFAAWMDGGWFNIRGGAELTLFTKIVQERWKAEDPEGLVAWALKNKSDQAYNLLNNWAANDPQHVLDFFQNHPDDTAEINALTAVAKKNPAMALQRLQEMTAAGNVPIRYGTYASDGLLREIAKQSPDALEAVLVSLPGEMKKNAESLLIGGKMKDSFGDELVKLQERPDGFALFSRIMQEGSEEDDAREAMRDKLLADLADLPESWRASIAREGYGFVSRKTAERWATADLEGAGFSAEQANAIRSSAVSHLYDKPEVALKLLAGLEMDTDYRRNLLGNIFGQLGGQPERIAEVSALLTSDEDRQYVLTLTKRREDENGEKPKLDTPAGWLAATLQQKNGVFYEYDSAAQKFDSAQRADLVRQFNSLPDETKRAVAEISVRNNFFAGPLDAEAVRYLVAHPAEAPESEDEESGSRKQTPEERTIRLASSYVGTLAQTDPTAAGEWIATLPAGQPRLWAQKNLDSLWSQYDPAAAGQWKKSLPATDRSAMEQLGKKK